MIKRLFLSVCFIILILSCRSQSWEWARQNSGSSGNGIQSAVDRKGNVYVILDAPVGTIGTYGTQTFTAETVIAKHDSSGQILWAYPINTIRAFGISTDTSGNVYLSGGVWNGAIFHSAINTVTVSSKGGFDAFLAKYNSGGNLIWIKTWGDTVSDDKATTLKTDPLGNSYVSGFEKYVSHVVYTHYVSNFFVSKYDNNGNLVWNKNSGWVNDYAEATIADLDANGNYYVTGMFYDTIFFNPTTLISSGADNIFIVKYDKNGNMAWVKRDGSPSGISKGISLDNKGYFYLIGQYASSTTFGTITLNGPSYSNMFIVKYDISGNIVWAKNENVKAGQSIACDSSGFFITGCFGPPQSSPPNTPSTGTLGIGLNSISLYSPIPYDFFIARYDSNCNLKWAIVPNSSSGSSGNLSSHIFTDQKNNCYVTGLFNGTTKCGNTTIISTNANYYFDAFVIKIKDSNKVTTTSLKSISSTQNNLKISPNPTGAIFNINYNAEIGGNITLKICDAVGKCFYSTLYKNFNGEINETIDLSHLAKGIYFIEIVGIRTKEIKKLVLQ